MLSSFLHKTLPELHHYPHFTARKQNLRELQSFAQGHTANYHGGGIWKPNCLVPKAKFFPWDTCLSYNSVVISLLIIIIHCLSHSNVFFGFCLFVSANGEIPSFHEENATFLTEWPAKFLEESPPPHTPQPTSSLTLLTPIPTWIPCWIPQLAQLELKSFLEVESVLLPEFK